MEVLTIIAIQDTPASQTSASQPLALARDGLQTRAQSAQEPASLRLARTARARQEAQQVLKLAQLEL